LPVGHTLRVELQLLQHPQGIGGQAIAAALIAGECGLIYKDNLVALGVQGGSTSSPRGTGSDNEDLGAHGSEVTAQSGYVWCDTSSYY
jgi:hypothetical protein